MKFKFIFLLGIAFFLCALSPAYSAGGAGQNFKMIEAVRNNSLDEVKILAADGVNINASDDSGLSCLMIAVSKNHIDIINYLVSKGVELNAKDKPDGTPCCTRLPTISPTRPRLCSKREFPPSRPITTAPRL